MAKIYIETSIVSYLTARPSNNLITAAWQQATIDWWNNDKDRFAVYISEIVIEEASKGDQIAASKRLSVLRDIEILQLNETAIALAKELIKEGCVPNKALDDALHIAITAINNIEFLLTWNCKHINNAEMKPKIRKIIEGYDYQYPEIATPIEFIKL
ncbi:hypothetical protein TI05_11260 [Achromatium sp. WMS3]|nr:hypothetical protein TI05_11260 [Achromatium sp. WMS3]